MTVAILSKVRIINPRAISIFQIALASCFIGICAQIKIPLYFTPIPLTVQTSAVMLVGALLGSRKGALAALCYLIQGCIGLHVFAGGAGGILHFFGPTGGYLMGYPLQAYLIGLAFERKPSLKVLLSSLILSVCIQLGMGSVWLGQFLGFKQCLTLGFYPFVAIEITKALLVVSYVKSRNRRNHEN